MAFGGAVKLTGESEYKKALQQITQGLKEVSAQMKLTTAQYSSNDTSMSALSAKSSVLVDKLSLQESKLATLRKQYEAMNEQYSKNTSKHNALLQKYEEEKSKLEYIGATLGTTSKEYKAQEKVVEDLAAKVKKSTDNQDANAKSMSNMSIEITKAEASVEKTKNAISQLDTEMEKSARETDYVNSAYGELESTISEQESKLKALKAEYANVVLEQGKNSKSAKDLEIEMSDLDGELANNKSKLKEADEASSKLSKSLDSVGESAEKSSDGFTVLKGAIANLISNGIQKLASAIKGQLSSAIERVDTLNSYRQTMENLGYTQEEVAKTTEKLKSGIEGLPTTLPSIMSMQQQYAALGGSIDDATELTLALNNATLSGGQGQEVANRALQQWYKIIAAGKPDAESWRIINSAMPAQMNQIAKSMIGAKSNSQDLFNAWKDGTVKTDQIKKALVDLNKSGGGGMTSFEKQVGGATSGIKTSMSNVKAAVANGVAGVVEAIGSKNISKGFDNLKQMTKGAFEGISTGIKFVIENKDAFMAGITGITAGLTAFVVVAKGAEILSQLSTYVNTLKASFMALNTVLSANAIGIVVAGVTAAVTAFEYYRRKTDEVTVAHKEMEARIKSEAEAIEKNRESWNELVSAQQKAIDASMTEMSNYAALYDELQSIVDQNGRVKKGYEERASFITSTLSDALGIEIKNVDNVIQGYDNLKKSIEEVMQKKKAQIILDSQESLYSEAIGKQQEALKNLIKTESELEESRRKKKEAEDEYAIAHEDFVKAIETADSNLMDSTQSVMEESRKKLNTITEETQGIEQNYNSQLEDIEKYAYNISQYETNMQLAHAGKYDEMTNTNWEYVKDYQSAGDAQRVMLENQVKEEEKNLNILKALKDKSGSDIYDSQIRASENRLNEAKESLKKYTSVTEAGLNDVENEWKKSLADQLSEISGKKVEFRTLGDGTVQAYVDGFEQGEPKAENEAKQMAQDMIKKIKDEKSGATEAGKNIVAGVGEGISNQSSQNSVFSKIKNFASNLLAKLKSSLSEHSPSEATKQMGKYLLEGLTMGVESGEGAALRKIGNVGQDVVNTLQNEMNQGVALTNATSRNIGSNQLKNNMAPLVTAFKDALSQMTVEMDDVTMGKFVEKTVAKAIYS